MARTVQWHATAGCWPFVQQTFRGFILGLYIITILVSVLPPVFLPQVLFQCSVLESSAMGLFVIFFTATLTVGLALLGALYLPIITESRFPTGQSFSL